MTQEPPDYDAEQMRADFDQLEQDIGRLVIRCSAIDYAARETIALLKHPVDGDARAREVATLYGKRSRQLAKMCIEAAKASSLGEDDVRGRLIYTYERYLAEALDERDRMVHDAFHYTYVDGRWALARTVTERGSDGAVVTVSTVDNNQLTWLTAMVQGYAFEDLHKLKRSAGLDP